MTNIKEILQGSDMLVGEGYPLGSSMVTEDAFKASASNMTNIPGLKQTTNFRPRYAVNQSEKKKGKIAKFFSNMARMGMNYDEDVIKNLRALPADKNFLPKPEQFQNQDLFSQLSSSWKVKQNADKNFFEKDFSQKRDALRKLALQPELEDILDTMSNESIVYDSDYTYFAEPFVEPQEMQDFKKSVQKKINDTINVNYRRFYKMLNWKYNAWDDFKRFLIEGILSYEIVYDDLAKPTKIIGIVPIDAVTLTRKFENNKWYWYQFKGIQGKERKLLDSQIIYVTFQETNCISRLSYLERLIRPFNIYRIVEQAQLIWTITNASYKMKFTIPVKGMNKTMGMQTLSSAMNKYKEDIKFVTDTGELQINGKVNMPFNKEYWFPESESGSPQIETLGGEGPELSDNDQLKFFKNQLYKISKIPLNRFDQESGESWFGTDPTSVARTEIDFARFVNRLRNQFAQIIIKPLQLQVALDIPELQENRQFLEAIALQFKSYNLFEEMMELELTQKRCDFIQSMKDSMVDMDAEGNEIKYFSSKFLVQKYLKMSDADLKLNEKMKKEEMEEMHLAGNPDSYNLEEGENNSNESVIDNQEPQVKEELYNIIESMDEESIKLLLEELKCGEKKESPKSEEEGEKEKKPKKKSKKKKSEEE